MAQCCATTRSGGWSRYGCSREAQPGSKFCFQHDPVNIAKKHEERHAKWKRESEVRERIRAINAANQDRANRYRTESEAALRKIAEGHNDPRRLARKVLKILEEGT